MRKDSSQPHPTDQNRTRRPRGSLTPEVILDAAEKVAADGFDALTMRAVAARLGAVPMALYNHFATKEQLVDALLDRVLGRFEPQPHTDAWAEDLRRFARAHRRLLVTHPWAVAPLFTQPNPGISSVRIGEFALAILRRGGLSNARAVAAFSGTQQRRASLQAPRAGRLHRQAQGRRRQPHQPRRHHPQGPRGRRRGQPAQQRDGPKPSSATSQRPMPPPS
jgi:AcrR family transcriptional regulator